MGAGSNLKSTTMLEQEKKHLATDAAQDLKKKIDLVCHLNISPKKIGIDKEVFIVDLQDC